MRWWQYLTRAADAIQIWQWLSGPKIIALIASFAVMLWSYLTGHSGPWIAMAGLLCLGTVPWVCRQWQTNFQFPHVSLPIVALWSSRRTAEFSKKVATARELRQPYLKDRTVLVRDIPMDDPAVDPHERPMVVRYRTFDECDIVGPAVIFLRGACRLEAHTIEIAPGCTPDDAFIDIQPGRRHVFGIVVFDDCTFRRCQFMKIGFLRHLEVAEQQRYDAVQDMEQGEAVPTLGRSSTEIVGRKARAPVEKHRAREAWRAIIDELTSDNPSDDDQRAEWVQRVYRAFSNYLTDEAYARLSQEFTQLSIGIRRDDDASSKRFLRECKDYLKSKRDTITESDIS